MAEKIKILIGLNVLEDFFSVEFLKFLIPTNLHFEEITYKNIIKVQIGVVKVSEKWLLKNKPTAVGRTHNLQLETEKITIESRKIVFKKIKVLIPDL
jgi:hypothetical protein